jgi:polysaccharide export outer membrane protein/exopolysaccharide production protein ExoF
MNEIKVPQGPIGRLLCGQYPPIPLARGLRSWLVALSILALSLMPAVCTALNTSTYLLDSGDKLQISVFDRPELSGEYEVRPSGDISFPLVGRVPTRGLTLAQVEQAIERALSARRPVTMFVNIEVVEYRPFYMDGDVMKPGAYPYRNGLNVMRAIALAGGRYSERAGGSVSTIEKRRESENSDLLVQTFLVDAAREARLLAEKTGIDEIAFPEDIVQTSSDPRVKEIIDNETHLFNARRETLVGQVTLLEKQASAYDEGVAALVEQEANIKQKQRIVGDQLETYRSLSGKGVVPRTTALLIELNALEAERQLLQVGLAILDAKQKRIQIQQAIVNIRTQRANQLAEEYLSVQERLNETEIRIRASAERLAWMSGSSLETEESIPFVIRRRAETGYENIVAGADTPVLAGDQVSIAFPKLRDISSVGIRLPSRISRK